MDGPELRIACWNTEWRAAGSWQGAYIRRTLLAAGADIVCCPEASQGFLAPHLNGVASQPDYGYPMKPGRRKVTLWSKAPWSDVDDVGSADLPGGRFVSAVTDTPIGSVRVVGICVPWASAHVSTGRRDRRKWEDHGLYLRGLGALLAALPQDCPTIVIGDVNQSIPRQSAPVEKFAELNATLAGYEVWTRGVVPGLEKLPVCHIMGLAQFDLKAVLGYSRDVQGRPVSDHDGLLVAVTWVKPGAPRRS